MAASNLIQALIIIQACEARAKFGDEKAEEIARMVGELASYLRRIDVSEVGEAAAIALEEEALGLELYSEGVIDGMSPEAISGRLLQ